MSENNEPKKDAVLPELVKVHSGSTPSEEDNDVENGYNDQPPTEVDEDKDVVDKDKPTEVDEDKDVVERAKNKLTDDEYNALIKQRNSEDNLRQLIADFKEANENKDEQIRQLMETFKYFKEANEKKDEQIRQLMEALSATSADKDDAEPPADKDDAEPPADKDDAEPPADDKEKKIKENMANILVEQIGEDPSKLYQAISKYRNNSEIMNILGGVLVKQIGEDPFKLSQAIRTYRGDSAIMNILGNVATAHMDSLSKVPVITDDAEPPGDKDDAEPPGDKDDAEPPADKDDAEPPADKDDAEPPADKDDAEPPGDKPPGDKPAGDAQATTDERMENIANERYPDPNNPNRDRFKDGMKFVIDRLPFPVRIPVLMIMHSALRNHPEDFNKLAGKESPREARMAGANLAVKSATALKNGCKSIYQSTKSIMKFFAPDVSKQTVAKDEKKKNILLRGAGKMGLAALACTGATLTLMHFHVPVDHVAQTAAMKISNFSSHPIDNTMYALAKTLSMVTHPVLTAKQIMSGDFIHSFTQNFVTSAPAPSNVSAVANDMANGVNHAANHVANGVNHAANHVANGVNHANHEHLNHGLISQGANDDKLIDAIQHHVGTGHEETINHLVNNHNISDGDAKKFVDMMQRDEIPHHTPGESQEQRHIIARAIDEFANKHDLSSTQMLHLQNLQEKIQLGNNLPAPPINPKM